MNKKEERARPQPPGARNPHKAKRPSSPGGDRAPPEVALPRATELPLSSPRSDRARVGGNFKIFCSSLRSALGRGPLPWLFGFGPRSRQMDRFGSGRLCSALGRLCSALFNFPIFLAPSRGLPLWSGSCSLASCNPCFLLLSVRICMISVRSCCPSPALTCLKASFRSIFPRLTLASFWCGREPVDL